MKTVIANHNTSLEIVSAFRLEAGDVVFETQPVVAFGIEDGQVADVIGIDTPTDNERRAVFDAQSGKWWMLGDTCGSGLEECYAFLAGLFGSARPSNVLPMRAMA